MLIASEVLGMPGIGGPGTADSLLAIALGRSGHQVEVLVVPGREILELSPEWDQAYAAAGVHVRRLAGGLRIRPPFLEPAAAVLHALRSNPPDVVIADDWRALAFAALRARQVGLTFAETSFVVYAHGPARVLAEAAGKVPDTLDRFGEEVAQRQCLELADIVVSPSEWLLAWMRCRGWPVPETARVIQNLWHSVAVGESAPRAEKALRIRRLAFFGQLREGKGPRVFAEALRRIDGEILRGVDLLFLGRETPRWTTERMREALGVEVLARVSSVRFESSLGRTAALAELRAPGTLAVMPSLLENSPYAVVECIEQGIPFIGSRTGGVPELLAEEDRERVLCRPTADAFAEALTHVLTAPDGFAPAGPARPPGASLAAWLEVIDSVVPTRRRAAPPATRVAVVACGDESARRALALADCAKSVAVDVVAAKSRREGLDRADADWVAFFDDDDVPDDGMLDALVAAQAASDADVVTAAVRPRGDSGEMHLFLGDPAALGLVENQYGVLGLVRRSLAATHPPVDALVDADWPFFARLALAGARVVSIPEPLSDYDGRPGTAWDVPGEGLVVLEAFEARTTAALNDLPELAATVAAAWGRLQRDKPLARVVDRGMVRRVLHVLRREGLAGVGRRVGRRLRIE